MNCLGPFHIISQGRGILLGWLPVLLVASPVQAKDFDLGDRYLWLTDTVVTPHIPWAKPYALGKTKVLFIGVGREAVELAQRIDLDWEAMRTVPAHGEWEGVPGASAPAIAARLARQTQGTYDVVVLGQAWNSLPSAAQENLLQRLQKGMGLVLVGGDVKGRPLEDLLAGRATPPCRLLPSPGSFACAHVPFLALPVFDRAASEAEAAQAAVRLYAVGRGRVAGLPYLTPPTENVPEFKAVHYEYYMALLARILLWAAGKEPPLQFEQLNLPAETIERDQLPQTPLSVTLRQIASPPLPLTLALTVRDEENQVECQVTEALRWQEGRTAAQLPLPRLKAGRHFADVWVHQGEKVATWGSLAFTVRAPVEIAEVSFDREYYEQGDTARCCVNLVRRGPVRAWDRRTAERPTAGLRLVLCIRDNYGRCTYRTALPLAGQRERWISFPIAHLLTPLSYAEAALEQSGETMAAIRAEFLVRQPPTPADDFSYVMWWMETQHDYLKWQVSRQLVALGVDTADVGGGAFPGLIELARANLRPLPYITRYAQEALGGAPLDLIRRPCLTDPAYREEEARNLIERTRVCRKFSPLAYSLGDENFLIFGPGEVDVCFSPTCIADFRQWVRDRYGTISALNEEWGTTYHSFDEVDPISLEEAQKTGQIPRWADHRLHMEEVFTRMHAFARRIIRREDPGARVGMDGIWYPTSRNGYDWWKLTRSLDVMNVYWDPACWALVRSFARPGMLTGGWYGGYGYGGHRDTMLNELDQRAFPWQFLFQHFNSAWFFDVVTSWGPDSGIAADLSPYPYFAKTMEEVREIKRGVGKLLLSARREHDGIALHYSPACLHASTATGQIHPNHPRSGRELEAARNWLFLLEDAGFQANFLAYQQILDGAPATGKYRVLILPFSQAISTGEAAAIRTFVRAGGTLLADLRPGVFDGHVKKRIPGMLDDVFGIRRDERQPAAFKEQPIQVQPGGLRGLPLLPVDPQVQPAGATPLASAGRTPLILVHSYGRGRAILLNFGLEKYASLRADGQEMPLRRTVEGLLQAVGVRPVLQMIAQGRPLQAVQAVRFSHGDNEYVGILKAHGGSFARVNDLSPKETRITFAGKRHLYDVRRQQYLGYSDRVETILRPAQAQLYARLPYRVTGIEVKAPTVPRPGTPMAYSVVVRGEGTSVGTHVVHVQVFDPTGRARPEYAANLLAEQGKAAGGIPFALNDPAGVWKIVATDVASGKSREIRIQLRRTL